MGTGTNFDVVKSVVDRILTSCKKDDEQWRGRTSQRAEAECDNHPKQFNLYTSPCLNCRQLCNCFPKDKLVCPDVVVRSLDGELVRLSGQLVRASATLYEKVKPFLRNGDGNELGPRNIPTTSSSDHRALHNLQKAPPMPRNPRSCILTPKQIFKLLVSMNVISGNDVCKMGSLVRNGDDEVMLLFDAKSKEPTIGLNSEILILVNYYMTCHLQEVHSKRTRELKSSKSFKVMLSARMGYYNSAWYTPEWETELFNVNPSVFLELCQANVDLIIWDFYCGLLKWIYLNRGIPPEEVEASFPQRSFPPEKPKWKKPKSDPLNRRIIESGCVKPITAVEPKKVTECSCSAWDLYLLPCLECYKFCNCSYSQLPKRYPDVLVRSLDKEIVRLSGELVQASSVLSKIVDSIMMSDKVERKCYLYDPEFGSFAESHGPSKSPVVARKKLRLEEDPLKDIVESRAPGPALVLCSNDIRRPTLGITKDVLLKIDLFIEKHLEQVDSKVEAQKRCKRHYEEGVLRRQPYFSLDEINTFEYEDWEEELFNKGPRSLIELTQANSELDILDLKFTLEKWWFMSRGTPFRMVNGEYDVFTDPDFDPEDRQNVYGLPLQPFYNPYTKCRHKFDEPELDCSEFIIP